jgi:hypothetical protein
MFGATIAADTIARGAPQIFVELGGMTILIRGRRPGEDPTSNQPIRPYSDFSSHNTWGTDHFGFRYQGDLTALCADLRRKGVRFPVELKKGVGQPAVLRCRPGWCQYRAHAMLRRVTHDRYRAFSLP